MDVRYIAFYGTLMSSHQSPVDALLEDGLQFVSPCLIQGELYDHGRYPALQQGLRSIEGELYEITEPSILQLLDQYEAIDERDPSLPGFTRRVVQLNKPELSAWVYYYDGELPADKLITSNKWTA